METAALFPENVDVVEGNPYLTVVRMKMFLLYERMCNCATTRGFQQNWSQKLFRTYMQRVRLA